MSFKASLANVPKSSQVALSRPAGAPRLILSFDVEEHYRIEAAAGLDVDSGLRSHYRERLDASTRWLLDCLGEREIRATFFIVGEIARHNPGLVRAIHRAGHEIASHSWDHRRVHHFSPQAFRDDLLRCKVALEQVTGQAVVGFRAPTFSIVRETAWALDVLAESGFLYDSSIYPVWHDRYGVPGAPRVPFWAHGLRGKILELPPATWRVLGTNIPVGGGGYFRLLPLFFMNRSIAQLGQIEPRVIMLYFHPWEFDPDQARLPVKKLNGVRTYTGLRSSRKKLARLLTGHSFVRACDTAADLYRCLNLPSHSISGPTENGEEPPGRLP
jgi:polysaccharide deacetylase family protein (PEP-CTERM system associated)